MKVNGLLIAYFWKSFMSWQLHRIMNFLTYLYPFKTIVQLMIKQMRDDKTPKTIHTIISFTLKSRKQRELFKDALGNTVRIHKKYHISFIWKSG